jgi:hypothetical protein
LEFLFKPQNDLNKTALFQGDLLARTPALRAALATAHSYYAEADDYSHFMVLTQSCDLVRRKGRPCKSRYVTLAACRPASVVVERHKERQAEKLAGWPAPLMVHSSEKRILAQQLLERLLHNTEDGFFFVRKDSVEGVTQDLCAFLPLSVALRAQEHYDACAGSKIAELQDVFAAKVGWLAGNQYSRVGTPDLEDSIKDPDEYKSDFAREFLAEGYRWLSTLQLRALNEKVQTFQAANPGQELDVETAKVMLEGVPSSERILADQIVAVLSRNNLLADGDMEKAKLLLSNDRALKRVANALAPS